MSELIVSVAISAEKYLSYYQGRVTAVYATAEDGRSVHFPANLLRRYVTTSGVVGRFRLHYDAQGKVTAIDKL